ncbi:MAG: glycosyl transferase [Lachnospiraceae bacterium]|nr:glycosyl transferase [Lachnospiraceae bacterium]
MKYGYFDDINKEYVITTPETPLPWINYLGSNEFFGLFSNTCGGYDFYKDAKLLRLTRYRYNNSPYDSNGRYYYINDGSDIWNVGWQPTQTPLDSYECHHGMGYSKIISSKNGIQTSLLAFVPVNDNCEINQITLRNASDSNKEIDFFSYIEFCLWNAEDDSTNFQRNFSTGEVEIEGSTIYHKTEYRERRNHFSFYHVNTEIDDFDTDRATFQGFYHGPANPDAVKAGHCNNSVAHGWSPIGSHHKRINLSPGESISLIFIIGYCENPAEKKFIAPNVINKEPAHIIIDKYKTDADVAAAYDELKKYWDELLSVYTLTSDNEKLNRSVNIWNQYQCMVTFNMSRSASYFESGMGRGMGFRDSSQDLLGFVHLIPSRARERILDIANTQFPDGSAYHQYQPLTKTGNLGVGSGFNDDPLWLIAGTCAYIRETGDYSILEEMCEFDTGRAGVPAAPLFEHLRRSFKYNMDHKGPHKLPLIGRADWNDCLNLNCFSETPGESFQTTGPSEGPVAESVFIAGMYVKYGKEFKDLCQHIADIKSQNSSSLNKLPEVDELNRIISILDSEISAMTEAVETAGWDGKWFVRAYDANSNPVGSHTCEEGQIFIEPQGMCIMGGIGIDNGKAETALASVKERLDSKYGIMLNQPAYTKYHVELGEISSYPPGYKENAGIFCHNNPWIACAEAAVGHGDRAYEIYTKTNPVFLEEIGEIHRTEPYAYCQMVAGADAPTFGEGKNSWLTGTAAWTFATVSQNILGIKPTYDGLSVDPCIPSTMTEYRVTRKYRGKTYNIHVSNPNHVEHGVKSISINGNNLPEGTLLLNPSADVMDVEVILG